MDHPTSQRATNLALIQLAMKQISEFRSQETEALITDDFAFELPYGPGGGISVKGKPDWLQLNAWAWADFNRFRLEITQVHEMLSPDQLIIEYVSDGEVKSTGKPYRNRYIGCFRFRDGLICEWREFHNPLVPAEAMAR